jgi:hypothetical protein
VVRRAGTHTAWLELDYDGLEPPTALLADLAVLGWHPPATATPPHDAIDWTVPDRARGLGYTIRPFRVVGATVDPPAGSGPRGAWTEGEATTHLGLLATLLVRHAVAEGAADPGGGTAAPEASLPARPSPPPRLDGPADPPGATDPSDPADRAEQAPGDVLVTFVVEADTSPPVRALLEDQGLPYRTEHATLSVPQRYRGRDFTTDVAAVRFEVAAPPGAATALERGLDELGLDRALARLTIEPLEPSGEPDPGLAEVHPFRRNRGVA